MSKKTKRVILTAISAILLVALSVGVTLAYLTDVSETAKNTFTVGDIQIKLDEADVYEFGDDIPKGKEHGQAIEGADRVTANEYKIFPDHQYDKDPTVTVLKDSEACYVRAFVTVSNKAALDAIFAKHELELSDVVLGISTDWIPMEDTVVSGDTRTYEVRYKEIVPASKTDTELAALFTGLKAPKDLDNGDVASLKDLKIDVVAQAIQADGFKTAADAWAAFPTK